MPLYHRRSIRLKDYDYTQAGVYFVTICAYEGLCLFGSIVDKTMIFNIWGEIIAEEWFKTSIVRSNIDLDAFIVMPNHIHGIVVITDEGRSHPVSQNVNNVEIKGLQKNSLGAVIGQFKSIVTKRIYQLPHASKRPIWQRNYYENIVRNIDALDKIRAYIESNPETWATDKFFVDV